MLMTHSINYLDSAWKTVQGPEHLNITVNFNRIRFPELKFKKVGCGAPGRRGGFLLRLQLDVSSRPRTPSQGILTDAMCVRFADITDSKYAQLSTTII